MSIIALGRDAYAPIRSKMKSAFQNLKEKPQRKEQQGNKKAAFKVNKGPYQGKPDQESPEL